MSEPSTDPLSFDELPRTRAGLASMPRTRRDYERVYPGRNHESRWGDGAYRRTEVYHPTIDRVERGMMIRVWTHRRRNSTATWGEFVEQIDYEHGRVLVRTNIGGQLEHETWADIDDVRVVWSIGTYEEARRLIKSFTAHMTQVFAMRAQVKRPN